MTGRSASGSTGISAVAEERLALTERGDVRVQLKSAYRDGTTPVVLEPLDFLARLAALVPPLRTVTRNRFSLLSPEIAAPALTGRSASLERPAVSAGSELKRTMISRAATAAAVPEG